MWKTRCLEGAEGTWSYVIYRRLVEISFAKWTVNVSVETNAGRRPPATARGPRGCLFRWALWRWSGLARPFTSRIDATPSLPSITTSLHVQGRLCHCWWAQSKSVQNSSVLYLSSASLLTSVFLFDIHNVCNLNNFVLNLPDIVESRLGEIPRTKFVNLVIFGAVLC